MPDVLAPKSVRNTLPLGSVPLSKRTRYRDGSRPKLPGSVGATAAGRPTLTDVTARCAMSSLPLQTISLKSSSSVPGQFAVVIGFDSSGFTPPLDRRPLEQFLLSRNVTPFTDCHNFNFRSLNCGAFGEPGSVSPPRSRRLTNPKHGPSAPASSGSQLAKFWLQVQRKSPGPAASPFPSIFLATSQSATKSKCVRASSATVSRENAPFPVGLLSPPVLFSLRSSSPNFY
ncbi:hypothetical protein Q8A73_002600 [Channa argus]|nr:hypothetical protein Q8A73_002600 [Channa argus]